MSDHSTNYIQEIINLHIPRCAICSTEWCGKKSKRDIQNCAAHKDAATSRNASELILLPSCGCTHLKIVSHPPLSSQCLDTDFFQAYQEALLKDQTTRVRMNMDDDDKRGDALQQTLTQFSSFLTRSPIRVLSHNAMCRPCLELFLKASEEVEKQEETSAVYSTALQCPNCRSKYISRALSNILKDPARVAPILLPTTTAISSSSSSLKRNSKDRDSSSPSFAQSLECTIQTVRFWKRIQKIVQQNLWKKEKSLPDANSVLLTHSDLTKALYHAEEHSSDSCFSSEDEGGECDMSDNVQQTRKKRSTSHRVEIKKGELLEELLQKDVKFRQEVENEKLLLSMSCESLGLQVLTGESMEYAEYLKYQAEMEKQMEQDRLVAENLQRDGDESNHHRSTLKDKKSPSSVLGALKYSSPEGYRGDRKRRKSKRGTPIYLIEEDCTNGDDSRNTDKKKSYSEKMLSHEDTTQHSNSSLDHPDKNKIKRDTHIYLIEEKDCANGDGSKNTDKKKSCSEEILCPEDQHSKPSLGRPEKIKIKRDTSIYLIEEKDCSIDHDSNNTAKKKSCSEKMLSPEDRYSNPSLDPEKNNPSSSYPKNNPSSGYLDKEAVSQSLKLMVDMGFPLSDCEWSLRDAKYDVELAISMIVSGQQQRQPKRTKR